ncbi:Aminoglycoside N(6')-acetyltransferase type 1 [Alphaproteobacteria bacterium SO-S41]|nr:Aminoglycoside N(6')-acetyltransferase type 1 [Alphaproteobacteria bacterium SO-S41]
MNPFDAHFAHVLDAGEGLILRPLEHADMPAVRAMFDDPEVARWWTSPPAEIADIIDEPTVWPYLALLAGAPVGYVQIYHANPEPFWRAFGVPTETFGLDMFLTRRGEGIGTRLTRAAVLHVWALSEVARIQIDPDPANPRAIRAYEKAGFTARGAMPGYDGDPMLYMTIERG